MLIKLFQGYSIIFYVIKLIVQGIFVAEDCELQYTLTFTSTILNMRVCKEYGNNEILVLTGYRCEQWIRNWKWPYSVTVIISHNS